MTLLAYLLKMIICSGLFTGYYWLFLRNRRFHQYNRFYLLCTLLLPLVLPLVKIPVTGQDDSSINQLLYQTVQVVTIQPQTDQPTIVPVESVSFFTLPRLTMLLYAGGIGLLLYLFFRSLLYIRRISRKHPYERIESLRFYRTNEPGTPFSFFRSVFWNDELPVHTAQGQHIFRHELFHVRQKHSADILLAELICIFGWFNPFFHLTKKELKAIHEFLADQYAASGSDRYAYAELLVRQVMITKYNTVSHYFFQNHIKRRITMITQLNTHRFSYLSRLMVLPVSVILFFSVTLYAGNQQQKPGTALTEKRSMDTLPDAKTAATVQQSRNALLAQMAKETQDHQQTMQKLQLELRALEGPEPFNNDVITDTAKIIDEKRKDEQRVIEMQALITEARNRDIESVGQKVRMLKEIEIELTQKKMAFNNQQKLHTERMGAIEQEIAETMKAHKDLQQMEEKLKQEKIMAGVEQKKMLQEMKVMAAKEEAWYNESVRQTDSTLKTVSRFFNKNLRYPQAGFDKDTGATVHFSFDMDATGALKNYRHYTKPPSGVAIQEIVVVAYGTTNNKPHKTGADVYPAFEEEVKRVAAKGASPIMHHPATGTYYFKVTFLISKE